MERSLKQEIANCVKIVLFGPESTGKTTLCKDLAAHYNTLWVPEYMRVYLEDDPNRFSKGVSREDLLPIAFGQMVSENSAARQAGLLFCDTDLLQLKVYSEYYHNGYCPEELEVAAQQAQYDCYLLCDVDVPWQPDPLRDRPFDRLTLFRIFESELNQNNRAFHLVSGGREERLRQAVAIVDALLQSAC